MNRIFLCACFLLFTAAVYPQDQLSVFGSDRPESGQRIVWTGSGYYLLLQTEDEVGGQNGVLVKLSADESIDWSRAFGTPGRDLVTDLEGYQDGSFVCFIRIAFTT